MTLLNQREAAQALRLSERTLERRRVTGDGPPFVKLGRRVLYQESDIWNWVTLRLRHSTSDRPAATEPGVPR
jgi:predicted DNA-binding transcriptional regulator AlpA